MPSTFLSGVLGDPLLSQKDRALTHRLDILIDDRLVEKKAEAF